MYTRKTKIITAATVVCFFAVTGGGYYFYQQNQKAKKIEEHANDVVVESSQQDYDVHDVHDVHDVYDDDDDEDAEQLVEGDFEEDLYMVSVAPDTLALDTLAPVKPPPPGQGSDFVVNQCPDGVVRYGPCPESVKPLTAEQQVESH